MRDIGAVFSLHPLSAFLYFLCVMLFSMFATDPVLILLSLLGAAGFLCATQTRRQILSDIAFFVPLFLLLCLVNPLFSHNGQTPLFFLNDNPVTLEALLYGMDMSAIMIAVALWAKGLSAVMTTDKVLWLFSRPLPRTSLLLSMSLRFLPLFRRRWGQIRTTQIALGYYSDRSITSKLWGELRVFSALVTWALENGVNTGASMRARGYGTGRRTYFSRFRVTRMDVTVLCGTVLGGAALFIGMGCGVFSFFFYPRISPWNTSPAACILYGVFAVLSFFPAIFETVEALQWKSLRSTVCASPTLRALPLYTM